MGTGSLSVTKVALGVDLPRRNVAIPIKSRSDYRIALIEVRTKPINPRVGPRI